MPMSSRKMLKMGRPTIPGNGKARFATLSNGPALVPATSVLRRNADDAAMMNGFEVKNMVVQTDVCSQLARARSPLPA